MREWPTLALLAVCYTGWALGTTVLADVALPLAVVVVAITTALHASLTHEMLHGHPFRNRHLNAALVFPNLPLLVPYIRFRDTHLAHHRDETLTDPYDDPESNFLDPDHWAALPGWMQAIRRFNNTLLGRILIGPALSQTVFLHEDLRLARRGDRRVIIAWLWHIPAMALVIGWMLSVATLPVWAWLIAVYAGHSLLKIRTYLEHQAHADCAGRTVVVEDRGLLSWLFLNNNFHIVHHMHPKTPWYDLPALYRARRDAFLARNHGYRFASYAQVFRRHLLRAKDPVAHPLWRRN